MEIFDRRSRLGIGWRDGLFENDASVWMQEHPDAVSVYREEESRYKADRKQVTRARRIVAAKLKREKS